MFNPFGNVFKGFEVIGDLIVSFFGIDASAFEDLIDDIAESHVDKMMDVTAFPEEKEEKSTEDKTVADNVNDELSESMHKSRRGYLNVPGDNIHLDEVDIEMSVIPDK